MKKKLKLDDLRVQSFITELKPDVAHTAKGGDDSGMGCIITILTVILAVESILHGVSLIPESCVASHCVTTPGGGGGRGPEIDPGSPPPIVITPDPPTVPPTLPPHTIGG
jgi:hypothetical protein